jgi:hypothetical protein
MNLNTLKRYAKKASKQVEKSADYRVISKRLAGSVRAMQKINACETYNSLSSLNSIFKKWGKL